MAAALRGDPQLKLQLAIGGGRLWNRLHCCSVQELGAPPILVCVKLFTPDLHGRAEAQLVCAADQ